MLYFRYLYQALQYRTTLSIRHSFIMVWVIVSGVILTVNFKNIDRDMRRLRLQSNSFSTQSRQYFDKDKNSYVIEIKASGLDKNDLDISTEKNMLIIKGSQKIEKTSKHSSLRTSSNFSHSVSIPVDGDGENISADFNNGILKVSIPKLDKPKPKSQKININ